MTTVQMIDDRRTNVKSNSMCEHQSGKGRTPFEYWRALTPRTLSYVGYKAKNAGYTAWARQKYF